MFDNIKVPKAYLKSLLSKEQEKLVDRTDFQTKSLDNTLVDYKVYKQKLFLKCPEKANPKEQWEKISYTGEITFYNLFREESDIAYWALFTFTFIDGKVDKKELITFERQNSTQEDEKYWQKRNAKREAFQKTLKYKFYNKVSTFLYKLQEWAYQKTLLPVTKNTKKKEKLSFWKHS